MIIVLNFLASIFKFQIVKLQIKSLEINVILKIITLFTVTFIKSFYILDLLTVQCILPQYKYRVMAFKGKKMCKNSFYGLTRNIMKGLF